MSQDGGFVKCDGCGLWITEGGHASMALEEELCDECFDPSEYDEDDWVPIDPGRL